MRRSLSFARAVIALTAILVVAAACGERPPRLRIGIHHWTGLEFLTLAEERGYFKDEGLDVEFLRFSSLADEYRAFEEGDLDGAYGSFDQLVDVASRNFDAKLVLVGDISCGGDGVVAREGITDLRELRGKKIGVSLGSTSHFTMLWTLKEVGLKETDVLVKNLPEAELDAALADGRVDAVVTWEPMLSKYRGPGTGAHVIYDSSRFPDVIISGVAMRGDVIERRTKDVHAFIRASFRALDDTRRDKPAFVRHIMESEHVADAAEVPLILGGIELGSRETHRRLFGGAPGAGRGWKIAEDVIALMHDSNVVLRRPRAADLLWGAIASDAP